MHFDALSYFLLIPVIVAFVAYAYLNNRKRYKSYINFSQYDIVKELHDSNRINCHKFIKIINYIILGLFIIALAKPQIGEKTEDVYSNGADIIIALDISSSMEATDFKPVNRLEAAKKIATDFVSSIKYDRVGVVLFSGLAFTQSPLTNDMDSVSRLISAASPGLSSVDGTAIGSAIITACNRLKESEAKSKVIILITDGSNNIGEIDPVTAAEIAKSLGIKIYTIGAGTPEGGYHEYMDKKTGKMERVRLDDQILDEETLTNIADTTEGLYFRADNEIALKTIMEKIGKMEKTKSASVQFTSYKEISDKIIILIFILFMLNIFLENLFLRKLI